MCVCSSWSIAPTKKKAKGGGGDEEDGGGVVVHGGDCCHPVLVCVEPSCCVFCEVSEHCYNNVL